MRNFPPQKVIEPCLICGEVELDRSKHGNVSTPRGVLCYNCAFWLPWVERAHWPSVARVKGVHWYLGGRSYLSCYQPGTVTEMSFHDGHVLRSLAAFCQGAIPPLFLRWLPNNAYSVRQYLDWTAICSGNTLEDDERDYGLEEIVLRKPQLIQEGLF